MPDIDFRSLIPVNDNEWYNVRKLEKGISNINNVLADLGFAFSEIRPSFKINDDNGTIKLTLNIDEGKKISLNILTLLEIPEH